MTQVQETTQISRTEMKNILTDVNTPQFISFISNTPQKMNKWLDYWLYDVNGKKSKNPTPTLNPYMEEGIIEHVKKYKINTGFDYEDSVNRRRENEGVEGEFKGGYKITQDKEGEDRPQREVWFDMVSKGLVTDKKTGNKFYLRYQYCKDSKIGTPEFIHNGNEIDKEIFSQFLTKKNTDSYSNQGLEKTLNFQVTNLEHIEEITMNGMRYELVD